MLSIGACSSEITGSALDAETTVSESTTAETTASEEPAEQTEEPAADATETDDATGGDPEADVADSTETDAPESSDTDEPVRPSQPDDDTDASAEFSAASAGWFHVFCTGFGELQHYVSPDVNGMTDAEAIQVVVSAYDDMSQIALDTRDELDAIPAPDFPAAGAVAPAVYSWFDTVGRVYGDGAQRIASAQVSSVMELKPEIDSIEGGLNDVNVTLGAALDQVDEGTRLSVKEMPECAILGTPGA